jgi:hypothetical protein
MASMTARVAAAQNTSAYGGRAPSTQQTASAPWTTCRTRPQSWNSPWITAAPVGAILEMRHRPRTAQPRALAAAHSADPVRPDTPKIATVVIALRGPGPTEKLWAAVLHRNRLALGNRGTQRHILSMVDTPLPDTISRKSRTATLLLGIFTGFVGGHRFFVGKTGTGILMACTLGGLGLWWLADLIVIGTGEFTDITGRRIVRWSPDEELTIGFRATDPRLLEDLEQMRSEVYELQERVDFLERTLTQVRERPGLGSGGRP